MICSSWPVPKRRDDERLGLAAGEQRRAVRARQQADLGSRSAAPSWCRGRRCAARLARMAPRTMSFSSSLKSLPASAARAARRRTGRRCSPWRRRAGCCGPACRARDRRRRARRPMRLAQLLLDRGLVGGRQGQGPRLLGAGLGQLDDRLDHRLEALVAEHDGAEHDLLGQLLGFRFDHQHAFAGAGDDQVELRVRQLVELSG